MIVLVSLIVLLRGFSSFHNFRMVHPYNHIHSFLFLRVRVDYKRIYAHAYMRSMCSAAPLSRVSLVKWRLSKKFCCCCCFISCVDFVKRPCAWESEAVW